MAVMAWGENIQIFMELGFPVNPFTLDSATLGVLDEDYLDGTLIGDDVSPYAQEVSISRGRSDQLQNFNAGTCTVRLLNRDRRFDPINTSSPYWNSTLGVSGIAPRRKVTVVSNGVALFTGRITDIDVSYEPNRPNATTENSYVTITAADDFVLLANTSTANPITPSQQLSGARVSAILDLPEVAYPATRNIDAGSATLGGGTTFNIADNTNVLTYLQEVATSEQGYFFVAANGDLTFTDRIAASFTTPSAYFSDAGSNIPYTSLSVMYGQEFLYNKVVCTVEGGTDQTVNDVASQTEYGISTLNLSGLLLVDDAAALTLANDLLDRYKLPEYRFDKLQTIYNPLNSVKQGTLTAVDIADVVSITRTYPTGTPSSVTKEYSIENIRHVITPSSHTVEFGLAVADLVYPFVLAGYTTTTTRTNLILNPNFETSLNNWSSAQTGSVRSTDFAYSGTYSYKVTVNQADSNVAYHISSSYGVGSVTLSLYVYTPVGSTLAGRTISTSVEGGTAVSGVVTNNAATLVAGQWVRVSHIRNVTTAGTMVVVYRLSGTMGTAAGQILYFDAALGEQSSTLLPYFDGTYADTYTGYTLTDQQWNGTANASTSTAVWGLDSSYVGTPMDSDYALT